MNITELMKKAQSMQKQMGEMQQEMAHKIYEGKAGGDMVTVQMTGDGKMKKISLSDNIINKEEKEMLEDLIVAAHNDAKTQAEEDSKNQMGKAFGNMGPLADALKL